MKNIKSLRAANGALKTALLVSGSQLSPDSAERVVGLNESSDSVASVQPVVMRGALIKVTAVLRHTESSIALLIKRARKREPVSVADLNSLAEQIADCAAIYADALIWVLTSSNDGPYIVRKAVGCAVHAAVLGRFLGLGRADLLEVIIGALLLDIGKVRMPVPILAKSSALNDNERQFLHRHVAGGCRILETIEGLSLRSLAMVREHHERIDGSGYPAKMQGDAISAWGQFAGIIDTYIALCLNRRYALGIPAHEALLVLNEGPGSQFDGLLVGQYVCAIGAFPTGTWVELVNGCIAVVCMQRDGEPLSPQAAVIEGPGRKPLSQLRWLTLHERSVARALPLTQLPVEWSPLSSRNFMAARRTKFCRVILLSLVMRAGFFRLHSHYFIADYAAELA
jgi:HD-GYP domain-containing protein (c-di-GMP phosphodiesterase class II)